MQSTNFSVFIISDEIKIGNANAATIFGRTNSIKCKTTIATNPFLGVMYTLILWYVKNSISAKLNSIDFSESTKSPLCFGMKLVAQYAMSAISSTAYSVPSCSIAHTAIATQKYVCTDFALSCQRNPRTKLASTGAPTSSALYPAMVSTASLSSTQFAP